MSGEGRALLSRPLVRLACAVVGTGVLVLAVWAAGPKAVLTDLGTSLHALPLLAVLEAVMLGCSTLALRTLYGASGSVVPLRQWLRVAAAGYALGLVLPMGRGAGEAARAVILGRITGGARAAVAAVQMQGVTLLSTAVFTLPMLVATLVPRSGRGRFHRANRSSPPASAWPSSSSGSARGRAAGSVG